MLRLAAITMALLATPAIAHESRRAAAEAPEFHLNGDTVSIPFVMLGHFPFAFVDGEVNGIKGEFMLDTGDPQAIDINRSRVPVPGGREIRRGNFVGGRAYTVVRWPRVDSVKLPGGLTYGPITNVESQDLHFEKITPDLLGFIGYNFWKGYALKLDYKVLRATFYKRGPKTFLKGEKVVSVLPFETRKRSNVPIMTVTIDGVPFETLFDTGTYGLLYADAATRHQLAQAGMLKTASGTTNLTGVRFKSGLLAEIPSIVVHKDVFMPAAAAALGVSSRNVLILGFGFLRQYGTVWDFRNHILYLLKE